MKNFNQEQLRDIGRIENGAFHLNYYGAVTTYLLMALAIPFYVLPCLDKTESSAKIFCTGALLGLIIYGVFDMTNLALIKNYPIAFIGPDMAWGALVFGIVTLTTFKLLIRTK